MTHFINLPGFAGSGEAHWQSHWEAADERFRRFQPASWDAPDLGDWISALDRSLDSSSTPPVLVAHSLACLLVAHWSERSSIRIAGAFLVAPPDPKSSSYGEPGRSFAEFPKTPLRFPSVIIASSDDPFAELGFARSCAESWGGEIIEAGALGHIGSASNLGAWKQGRDLLAAFSAGLK